MNSKSQFPLFSLIFALFLVFFAVSCDDDDGGGNGNGGNKTEFLAALQNTQWKHTSGDKIAFFTDTATTTPVSGTEQTFTAKSFQTIDQINQTTYWFGESQGTQDYVVYRNGEITSVNLGGIAQGQGWSADDGKEIEYWQYIDPQLIGKWQAPSSMDSTGNFPNRLEFREGSEKTAWCPKLLIQMTDNYGYIHQAINNGYDCYTSENKIYAYWFGSQFDFFYYYSITDSGSTLKLYNSTFAGFPDLTLTRSSFTWSYY